MSVRKRKWTKRNGEAKEAWIVDYTDQDGERHIRTFARKKEADAYSQQVGVDVRAGTHTPVSKSITVAQAAEDWIKSVELEGREAATLAQYRQHARHIIERIGNFKLASLTTPRINGFRDDLMDDHVARDGAQGPGQPQVVATRCAAPRQRRPERCSWRQEDRRRQAPRGQLEGWRRHSDYGGDQGRSSPLPKGRSRPLLLTAIFTGLRASELRGLRWDDVDLKGGELHVRQRADRYNEIGKPKSKAGHRTVPLGPLVLNVLREWKLACPKGELGLVFPTASGRVAGHNDLVRALKSTMVAAGMTKPNGKPKYTGLHALRHFYASWCINPLDRGGQGLPPKVVQERLGHSSIVMTMDTYGHLFPPSDDADKRLAEAERALLG